MERCIACHLSYVTRMKTHLIQDKHGQTLMLSNKMLNLSVILQKYKCLYCIYKICMTEKNTCEEYTGIIYIYIYTYIHIHYNGTSLVIQQNIATSGCLWAAAHCCSGQGHKICMSGLKTLGEMPYVSTKSRCDPCLGSQRIGSNSIHESLLVSTLHKMRVMMSDVTFVTEMKIPSQKVGSMETYGNTNWIEFGTSVPASENSSHHLAQSTIVRVPVIRAEGKIYRALRRIWHGKSKYLKDPQKHHLSAGRELLQANLMRTCRERHRSHRWSGQFQATSGQQCLQYVAVVTCC